MTDQELQQIEDRWNASSKGEWVYERLAIHERAQRPGGPTDIHQVIDAEVAGKDAWEQNRRTVCGVAATRGEYYREEANGIFIAAAHQDIPKLVAEIKRLREHMIMVANPAPLVFCDGCEKAKTLMLRFDPEK